MSADLSRLVHRDKQPAVIAVAVCGCPPGTHAGVVFLEGLPPIRALHLLHFATHRTLKIGDFSRFRKLYTCVTLPLEHPGEEAALAGYCRRVYDVNAHRKLIPYNLMYDEETAFDPETGDCVISSRGVGMSCATFVLHLFRSAGIRLIDVTGWRTNRPGDKERWDGLIEDFRKGGDPDFDQQADRLDTERGCARVRPEDVAGACLSHSLPANYSTCEANGRVIAAVLERAEFNRLHNL